MIIILNDDGVYLSWIRRHASGFVLDTRRKPTRRNTVLHRAGCPSIRSSRGKRTHWTTGGRVKACSLDARELTEWVSQQTGAEPACCEACDPAGEAAGAAAANGSNESEHHLTPLGSDLVSVVVESAIIHLDNHLPYRMTVGELADAVSKSPAQIAAALRRLVDDQMLDVESFDTSVPRPKRRMRVFPTAKAMRAEPAFAEMSDAELSRELVWLRS